MTWLSQLRSLLFGPGDFGDAGRGSTEYLVGCYARSKSCLGAHIITPAEATATAPEPIANFAAYAQEDGGFHGSLLLLDTSQDASEIFNPLLDVACQFVLAETGLPLASCDVAARRKTSLANTTPLPEGKVDITAHTVDGGGGRFLLRWISNAQLDVGKCEDKHFHVVAALDLTPNNSIEDGDEKTSLQGHLAVFDRLLVSELSPLDAAWSHFETQLGGTKLDHPHAVEATRMPSITGIVMNPAL
ncbi:MAG: hypothetical protein IT427_15950 [Pirellulales bacterium]|nr:hypothetical protein [Pirellulales bacterium]